MMRSWESVLPVVALAHGFPGSHGPSNHGMIAADG
jgi:hypothetical protein